MNGVMMLVNEFPPVAVGGAEKQAERLSVYLAQRGFSVGVITRRFANLSAYEMLDGVKIFRPAAFGFGKLKTIAFIFGALIILWQQRKNYSVLHAHLAFGPALAALIAARWFGKRVIVKFGAGGKFGDIQTSQAALRGRLRLAALRRWADAIVVLDDEMYAEALAAGFDARRIRKMNNGINVESFAPLQSRDEAKKRFELNDKIVIVFIGRLAPQKSLPVLLNALARALPSCPSLHLVLVGDGIQRGELESLAQTLKIESRVAFTGNQSNVIPYLHAADIFALPSLSEGISNALLEAMSAQLTCLVSEVGGNAEVLDHGNCGVLLPVGDADAWRDALVHFGNSPEARARFEQAAHQRVLDVYDFRVVGAAYEKLYQELGAR